ncbi:argininosuccinate lyase [bacterium]|nr:argininosuccinate lyase [bacterium]
MTLWKGRTGGTLDAAMERLNRSLPVDIRLLAYDIAVNRAWIAELARLGVLSPGEAEDLAAELDNIAEEHEAGAFVAGELPDEDVHSLVERLLTERVGEAGARVHSGRSRNDQVATDLRLYLKDACDDIIAAIRELAGVLLETAEVHAATVMPGYTHLQPALPVTLGFDLASFASELSRDLDRFADARKRADDCPLGAGALAGSGLPVDRVELANALGFARPMANALDAVSSRDAALEFCFASVQCALTLSRRAEDGIIRATREFAHLRLPDATSTGSSMMPQKRNPDGLELVRAKAAAILGRATGLAALLKGLPHAYAKDLQEDKAAVFETHDALRLSIDVMRAHYDALEYDVDAMAAGIPLACAATDFADALVAKGVPFRRAHEIVSSLIRELEDAGQDIADLAPDEIARRLDLPEEVARWSPQASIERRRVLGGTAVAAVRAQIAALRRHFAAG